MYASSCSRATRPLKHGARVRFHQGTRELLGRVVLPDAAQLEPGASAYARIRLEAPAVLVRGDRFIVRSYSPLVTIAGGTILESMATPREEFARPPELPASAACHAQTRMPW